MHLLISGTDDYGQSTCDSGFSTIDEYVCVGAVAYFQFEMIKKAFEKRTKEG